MMKRISLPVFSGILFVVFLGAGIWMWRAWHTRPLSRADVARVRFFSDQVKIHVFNLYDEERNFFRDRHRFSSNMEELYASRRPLKTVGYTYGFLPDPDEPSLKTIIRDGRPVQVGLDDIPAAVKKACPDCHFQRFGFKAFAYGYADVGETRRLIVWTIDDNHKLANPVGIPLPVPRPLQKPR